MKKLLTSAAVALSLTASAAFADYTLVVPQGPGQGTAVWADIIARNLSKFTDEPVVVQHIPGARDIPGFNKFHNDLRTDDKTIMVAHGGNGVSFLLDDVDYNYFEYDLIGSMNNDIVLGKNPALDVKKDNFRLPGGSGYEPDGAAIAMLLCGPQDGGAVDAYLSCWRERVAWINGVKGGEKRLGFMNGEFDITRESPSAWFKFYIMENNQLWFTHGILNLETKSQMEDPNFPNTQFEEVYKSYWGVYPEGELYDAYKLTRNWRDAIQKSLWVNKGNPNRDKLVAALQAMLADPESVADIKKSAGDYPWIVGDEGPAMLTILKGLITEDALKAAVKWNQEAYGFPSVYKPELLN